MYILFFTVFLFILLIVKKNKIKKSKRNILSNRNYLKYFNEKDLKLRNCDNVNHCENVYFNGKKNLFYDEKIMLKKIVNDINILLNNKFSEIFANIKFIKVKDHIENSLPHTRNEYIVLSQLWFNNFMNKFKHDNNFILNDEYSRRLIFHEQFHIFQRYNLKKMIILYKKYWNLIQLNKELPKILIDINRTNPDALPKITNNWLFYDNLNNTYILPMCIYNTELENNNLDITDTVNIFIKVKKVGNEFIFENLNEQLRQKNLLINNKSYTNFFGNNSNNNYHPNEISASLFESIVDNEIGFKNANFFPAINKMKHFFRDYDLL